MIFAHTLDWVIDKSPHTGQPKSQTRRLEKQGWKYWCKGMHKETEVLFPVSGVIGINVHAIHSAFGNNSRVVYEVYRTYAIQPGRGKPAVGRFRLTGIRREDLQAISEADAQAEGCRDVAHYMELWDKIHPRKGERWIDNPKVVVLEMEYLR